MEKLKYLIGAIILLLNGYAAFCQEGLIVWGSNIGIEEDYAVITNSTSSIYYGSSGATSVNLFESGDEGLVRFPIISGSETYTLGFVESNYNYDYKLETIDFAVEVSSNRDLIIYEDGIVQETISGFSPGDECVVKQKLGDLFVYGIVRGNEIQMSRGSYQLATNSSYNIALIMKDGGTSLIGLSTSFQNNFRAEWESWSQSTVAISANLDIEKVSGSDSWNEAATYSLNRLPPGSDGILSYRVHSLSDERAVGLITDSISQSFYYMDYGCRLKDDRLMFYSKGKYTGSYSSLKMDDLLTIDRTDDVISVKINGITVKSYSNVDKSEELQVQTAIKEKNLKIKGVWTTFKPYTKLKPTPIRLVNADDPAHIPFTRVSQANQLAVKYLELYKAGGNIQLQVLNSDFQDVSSSVVFTPTAAKHGDNRIQLGLSSLDVNELYHVVVRDGMDRKWELNFYLNE